MTSIGYHPNALKFGVLLLRYPRIGYLDMVPERVLSNAKNAEGLDIQKSPTQHESETIPDMDFNKGDIVLLTPDRDKLIRLYKNNPTVERLVDQMVEHKTEVNEREVRAVVAKLAEIQPRTVIDQLEQAGFFKHEAVTVTSAMSRSLRNPGRSRTHFDRIG